MPVLKIYITEKQEAAISDYAAADHRSKSNLVKHIISGHMARCKKSNTAGVVIDFPDNS